MVTLPARQLPREQSCNCDIGPSLPYSAQNQVNPHFLETSVRLGTFVYNVILKRTVFYKKNVFKHHYSKYTVSRCTETRSTHAPNGVIVQRLVAY